MVFINIKIFETPDLTTPDFSRGIEQGQDKFKCEISCLNEELSQAIEPSSKR